MNILDSIIEAKGIDLSDVGINGYAFDADAALEAIELLRNASVKILGGDVLEKVSNGYELSYDNWYYENGSVDESCNKAKKYIFNYQKKNGVRFVYQLII